MKAQRTVIKYGSIDLEVKDNYSEENCLTVIEYLTSKKIDLSLAPTLSKRAAQFIRCSKNKEILEKNSKNQTIYRGNQINYLDAAIKTILDL